MDPSAHNRHDRAFDGTGHEVGAGYARGARRGSVVAVSGTTANDADGGVMSPGDTGAQTTAAFERALRALRRLGGDVEDVVRTRMYLAPGADWQAACAAHRDVFAAVTPANTTLFVHALIGADFLVEVEIEAALADPETTEA